MLFCLRIRLVILFIFILQINLFAENICMVYSKKIKIHKDIADTFKTQAIVNGFVVKEIAYEKENEELEEKIKSSNCNYFFTIGDDASKACVKTGFPGVFVLVTDPVTSGLIDKDGKIKGKMTGILINVSFKKQWQQLKDIFFSKTHGGIIYNPEISSYLAKEYIQVLNDDQFRVVDVPVTNKDDVLPEINQLKDASFILSLVDNDVYNAKTLPVFLRFSLTNKIPFVGFLDSQTKTGALVSFYSDFNNLGRQGAKLLSDLVAAGGNASQCPIQYPEEIKHSINKQIAEIMKLTIPVELEANAEEIYGK